MQKFQSSRGKPMDFKKKFTEGIPDKVIEVGYVHSYCENDLVIKSTCEKIPYFNANIYLEQKQDVGKVDEIFGPIADFVIK